eukprot:Skav224180  [mRNA]  locus=scaffold257:77958:89780:- [translate_table: standard]
MTGQVERVGTLAFHLFPRVTWPQLSSKKLGAAMVVATSNQWEAHDRGLSPANESCRCSNEFRQMLLDHGIDISKFGKGQAKTLDELYRNVAIEKKSYFVDTNNTLERRMELVNVSLTVTSSGTQLVAGDQSPRLGRGRG